MNPVLENARAHVARIQAMVSANPSDPSYKYMLAEAEATVRAAERMTSSPLNPVQHSLEHRVAQLEQRAHQASMVPVNKEAETGLAVMAAIGQSLTKEQTAFVQERLQTSPDFFASDQAHTAVGLFLEEWQAFEVAQSKTPSQGGR